MTRLLPLDTPELVQLVAGWLGKYENRRWLDFGNGVQQLTPAALSIMAQRSLHLLRVYTADDGVTPAGVAGLANLDRISGTASVWAVLGRKRYGGVTTAAVARLLTLGFTEWGLRAVNAWTVETNVASQRVLEALHFRYVGRMRHCHYLDGRPYDRLLYDLLASEHQATTI